MSFEWNRIHKVEDWIEREMTEAVEDYICDYYGIDDTDDMTEEQFNSVDRFRNDILNEYSALQYGFSNVLNSWENSQWEKDNEDA